MRTSNRFIISTLVIMVCISGITQGLTLPLLSVLLEHHGLSAAANGLNSTGLYIGIALASPFLERPLRKFGYKPVILAGLILMVVAIALFPTWENLVFWFALRLALGIGDAALHYASQIWITALSSANQRGRLITFYGFAYGIGFMVGPLGMFLLRFGQLWPFLMCGALYVVTVVLVLRLPRDTPTTHTASHTVPQGNRYVRTIRLGWMALLPSFLFGYLESSLNVNFPVYALRSDISVDWISILLAAFSVGGLTLQLPLGSLSDRVGRKPVLMIGALCGAMALAAVPFTHHASWLIFWFAIAGASVGSFYSMGMAFAADVLPSHLIPTVGMMMSVNYSIGSILAPNGGGFLLTVGRPAFVFYVLSGLLGAFVICGFAFRTKSAVSINDNALVPTDH